MPKTLNSWDPGAWAKSPVLEMEIRGAGGGEGCEGEENHNLHVALVTQEASPEFIFPTKVSLAEKKLHLPSHCLLKKSLLKPVVGGAHL